MKTKRLHAPVIPGFHLVQALRERAKQDLTPHQRKYLGYGDRNIESRRKAEAALSRKFAARLRRKGWLHEEGRAP